ncbi:MAG: ABC transporter substrate-binding protein, partial [Granulicella sp.]
MRIVSLQPSVAITLASLGRLDVLCACTKYCVEALPELAERKLPVLHDSWTADTEEIRATAPDLVIASVPYRMESLAAMLKAGLPVLALAPHDLSDIFKDIRLLASLVDARERGEAVIAEMQERLDGVRLQCASAPRRTVYCEEWGKPMIRSQHWVAELVEVAGGKYLGVPGSHTTAEEIASADPDVLLFAWCGAGDRVPLERVVAQRSWRDL